MARSDNSIRLLPPRGTHASLDLTGPGSSDFDTVVEAVVEGPAGNLVTLAAAADSVSLAAATLDLGTLADGALDTVVAAKTAGAAGNAITVAAVGDSEDGVTIEEDGTAVVIHYEDGVSTVANVETAIGASSTLIEVSSSGTGGTVLDVADDDFAATPLEGGTDAEGVYFEVTGNAVVVHFEDGVSTVEDFEAALAADEAASAVLRVKTAGTAANTLAVSDDDFTATALSGGGAGTAAAPTLGQPIPQNQRPFYADEAVVLVRSVAGSGDMTLSPVLWGWHEAAESWFRLGALNAGEAIAETSTDAINYAELVVGIGKFSQFACELPAPGGTGVEAEVRIDFVRPGSHD